MDRKIGAGILLTLLMVNIVIVLGSPIPVIAQSPTTSTIKIGVMGPMGLIQGQGMKEGAVLAAEEINATGGVNVGGTYYSIQLVFADEFQGQADGNSTTGAAAAMELVGNGSDFVIGGFRSEAVFGAREVFMDYNKIFLITGASTDRLIDCGDGSCGACVRCNYERYKYVFRITPVNATTLVKSLTGKWYAFQYGFLSYALDKLADIYGSGAYPQVKYAAVVEDLAWTQGIKAILGNLSYHLAYGLPNVWPYNAFGLADMYLGSPNSEGSAANPTAMWTVLNASVPFVYPPIPAGNAKLAYIAAVSPTATDLDSVLSAVKASGARVVIPILSAEKAGRAFTTSWNKTGCNDEAIAVGINLIEQMGEAWDETNGAVEYETIFSAPGTRTPITELSVPFWDAYVDRWGHAPVYTAFGAYDAMYILAEAIERAGTLDNDDIIPELEKTDRLTTLGQFKFTGPNPGHNGDYSDYDPSVGGNQPYPYNGTINSRNPTLKGTLHDVHSLSFGATWTDGYVRPLMCQWQKGRLEVVWPRDQPYSKKWKVPPAMYPLWETDLFLDGQIDVLDMIVIAIVWQTTHGDPAWYLDADIDGNGIINMLDICRVAKDWGKSESLPYDPGSMLAGASVQTASPIPAMTQMNPATMVYLDPPTINGTEVGVGNTVTVNVRISGAVEILGYQAALTFNTTVLDCTALHPAGDFLTEVANTYAMGGAGSINNTAGKIDSFGCTLLGDYNASGSGQLADLIFNVTGDGVSDLHLRDVMVFNATNVEMLYPFNIIDTYTVTRSPAETSVIVSNSTWQEATYGSGFFNHTFSTPEEELGFNVEGPYPGFSNVTIPKTLLNVSTLDEVLVIIDDEPLKTEERTVTENATHYTVYFNYTPGIRNIQILERPPVHNINANRYYTTIQKAINVASPGDKILTFTGTLYENVVVNNSISLIGENKYNTIIDGNGIGTVINVTASNVNISNLTIQNSGSGPSDSGIWVHYYTSGNNITLNIITDNHVGIYLYGSTNNILAGNNASNNEYGIVLVGSGNTLTNNTMSGNKYNFGLYGTIGSHFNNTIDTSNTVDGKPVYYVKNASNTVYNSSTNAGTLYLIDCTNVTVRDLTLTKNVNGIFLWNTTNSRIQNVNSSNNLNGIYLQGQSNYNNLTDNTLSNNELGIYLHSSNNTAIYHNSFIGNTIQVNVTESYNTTWDDGYYPSGGNYWSDHSIISPFVYDEFKGENQDVQGNDGIVDKPKVIDEENQDNYPLVSPLTPPVYNLNTHRGNTTIQGAIDASSNGNTIIVRNGTYYENVVIDRSLTLIGIMGGTVINGTGTVVTITADYVTFRGFNIQGSGSTDEGILVDQANNVVISENTVTKKGYGIWLDDCDNCKISGNTIKNNTEGIYLQFSYNAIISRNTITNNSHGIILSYSDYNDICRNNVTYNNVGITLLSSNNNTIYHDNFINNTDQVDLIGLPNNTWDNGTEGNYWSDYTGVDDGSGNRTAGDGVGDTLLPHQTVDWYPLMNPTTPQHGVATVSVTPSKPVIASIGRTISINVTVENHGYFTEAFVVEVYYNLTEPIYSISNQSVTTTSESSTTITFTWNTTSLALGNYTVNATATPVPGETDTADNTRTCWVSVTIIGDATGDGIVDIFDLSATSLATVAYYGPCDFNNDGAVDIFDLTTVALAT